MMSPEAMEVFVSCLESNADASIRSFDMTLERIDRLEEENKELRSYCRHLESLLMTPIMEVL